jgi:hypothetical protein
MFAKTSCFVIRLIVILILFLVCGSSITLAQPGGSSEGVNKAKPNGMKHHCDYYSIYSTALLYYKTQLFIH